MASVVLWIVFAVAVGVTALLPWIVPDSHWHLDIPVALAIDGQALHVAAPSLGVNSGSLADLTDTLKFSPPSRSLMIAPMLTIVSSLGICIWVLRHLRALFRSLRDNNVFAPDNVRHVRLVGWALIAAEPIRLALTYFSQAWAQTHFVGTGVRFTTDLDMNVGSIFGGLVVLILAEIFRVGTRLDQDQSLTI